MKKELVSSVALLASCFVFPVFFAFGIGLFDSDEAYMKRTGMNVEQALEAGVLNHPENYSGHCDFEAMEENGMDETTEMQLLFSEISD